MTKGQLVKYQDNENFEIWEYGIYHSYNEVGKVHMVQKGEHGYPSENEIAPILVPAGLVRPFKVKEVIVADE